MSHQMKCAFQAAWGMNLLRYTGVLVTTLGGSDLAALGVVLIVFACLGRAWALNYGICKAPGATTRRALDITPSSPTILGRAMFWRPK